MDVDQLAWVDVQLDRVAIVVCQIDRERQHFFVGGSAPENAAPNSLESVADLADLGPFHLSIDSEKGKETG